MSFLLLILLRCPFQMPEEVGKDKKGSALILWPGGKREQQPDFLRGLHLENGLVAAMECHAKGEPDLCQLAQASHALHDLDASVLTGPLGCLCAALDELCGGKVRSVMCLLLQHGPNARIHGGKAGKECITSSLLGVALMQARAQYFWLRKIVVVDCWSFDGGMGLSAHSGMVQDSDLLVLNPLATTRWASNKSLPTSDAAQAEIDKELTGDCKTGDCNVRFEEAVQTITDFGPQIVVFLLGDKSAAAVTGGETASLTNEMDYAWLGKWAADLTGKCCKGRSLTLSHDPHLLQQFLRGAYDS